MANITFFTGAGASYNACPILDELGDKMVELARIIFHSEHEFKTLYHPNSRSDFNDILWSIGYFGNKAKEYGTIDTYAKKLSFYSDKQNELEQLKLAISLFFTIWQHISDVEYKSKKINDISKPYLDIDIRYIKLFSLVLEKIDDYKISLKSNIKFVTWNYDLQIENAFKTFYEYAKEVDDVSPLLRFKQEQDDLHICHLNGYSGYYYLADGDEYPILQSSEKSTLSDILKAIDYVNSSQRHKKITFKSHINYAWETNNEKSNNVRKQAEKIFENTDILVIIGYSFPNFNKEIDKLLFSKLKNGITIYYQDPSANEEYIKLLLNGRISNVKLLKDKKDSFHLPYEF